MSNPNYTYGNDPNLVQQQHQGVGQTVINTVESHLPHHQGNVTTTHQVGTGVPLTTGTVLGGTGLQQGVLHQGGLQQDIAYGQQLLHGQQGHVAQQGLIGQGLTDLSQGQQVLHGQQGLVGQQGVLQQGGLQQDIAYGQQLLQGQQGQQGLVGTTGTTGHHGLGTGLATGAATVIATDLAYQHHQHQQGTTGLTTGTGLNTGTGLTTGTGGVGPGTITFRPKEGKFTHDKDPIGKMDPYCKFKIGLRTGKSSVAKGQGTHATWTDSIVLKVKHQEFAKLKVKDRDRLTLNDNLGSAKIPLAQVISQGRVTQWIPITKKDIVTGEVLVEMEFHPKTVL